MTEVQFIDLYNLHLAIGCLVVFALGAIKGGQP